MRYSSAVKKATLVVADQATFAGANFVSTLLLVRWLSPHDFGVFATTFAVVMLVAVLYGGLLIEPMLVFAAQADDRRAYMRRLLGLHWLLSAPVLALGGGVGAVALALDAGEIAGLAVAAAVSTVTTTLLWFVRRSAYVGDAPQASVISGFGYLLLLVALLWGASRLDFLRADVALVLIGLAGLVVAAGLAAYRWKLRLWTCAWDVDCFRRQWRLGKWLVVSGFLRWVPSNGYFVIVSLLAGVAAAGQLRALLALVSPPMHAASALTLYLTAQLAQLVRERPGALQRRVRQLTALAIGSGLAFVAATAALGPFVLPLALGQPYAHLDLELLLLSCMVAASPASAVLSAGLRARESGRKIAIAAAISACATLTFGLLLTYEFGLTGAAIGLVVGSALSAAYMWRQLRPHEHVPLVQPEAAAQ